ncbi:hypothetical protein DOY81_013349, partial [Sarcophaga bullata]
VQHLFGGKQIESTYRQMIGRAGRTGKDTLGESILICTDSNARIGKELIKADLRPISSCLDLDSSTHLKRALLEVISSGVATSKEDIDSFVNCTLLSAQKQLETQDKEQNQDKTFDQEYIGNALDFLIEYEFIRLQNNEETQEQYYVATRLGQACLASSMPPTDGLILFAELQKSRRCFVLESELHAVYLVTPYSVCYQLQDLDWLLFLDLWEKLTPAMKKVGELVGVKESFYTALALQELVNETPINKVAVKYKCSRGMLQSLQQMASTFAGIVTSFCNSLQWDTLSLIVSQFKERLYFGIHRDLIDLMRLPDLNHKRARALFDAGVTSLVELASSDVLNIEKILFNSLSFDSAKKHDDENEFEAAQRNEERNFFITGKTGLNIGEAAKMLIQDARRFVQYKLVWRKKITVPEKQYNLEENKSNLKPSNNKKLSDESQIQHFDKPLREQNNCAMTTSTQINLKENNATFEDDSKLLKAMDVIEEKVFSNKFTNHSNKHKKHGKQSLEKRKSMEEAKENLNVTPPKILKLSSNIEIKSTVKEQKSSATIHTSWENDKDNRAATSPHK